MEDGSQVASSMDKAISDNTDAAPDEEPSSSSAEDALRRAALRKAGADFLERALAAKAKGQDPFAAEIPSSRAAEQADAPTSMPSAGGAVTSTSGRSPDHHGSAAGASGRKRAVHMRPEDPDLIAFGAMFEKVKLYVYMGLYVLAQGTIYPLAKVGLPLHGQREACMQMVPPAGALPLIARQAGRLHGCPKHHTAHTAFGALPPASCCIHFTHTACTP